MVVITESAVKLTEKSVESKIQKYRTDERSEILFFKILSPSRA